MTKDQFLAEWINDNPTKESIPRFSVKEVLKLMQDWEDYIDKHLKTR